MLYFCFFFFKQKTAYEMLRSLVGSEMCIRDSIRAILGSGEARKGLKKVALSWHYVALTWHCVALALTWHSLACLLYTSDAADERSSVDLGGRRIIKKKKKCNI